MLLRKALASVGIGSAKIDTKLEKEVLVQGEEVRGVVIVKGGNVEQEIDPCIYPFITHLFRK